MADKKDQPDFKFKKLEALAPVIQTCRDFYEGNIKVRNETYLPKYKDESDEVYEMRSKSTEFVNMYAPIVDGLVGLVTKKDPEQEGFDKFELDNVDLEHNNLTRFIQDTAREALIQGLVFVTVLTTIDKRRSYLKRFNYEDFYSYKLEDGKLVQVVFREKLEEADGEFGMKETERFLVFKLGGGDTWLRAKQDAPLTKASDQSWVNSLDESPIVPIIVGKQRTRFEIIPRLYDIVVMNMVHLNREGNIANLVNITSNPIPVFYGDPAEDSIQVGVDDALIFEDKQKEGFEYVEVTGNSIKIIQDKAKTAEESIDRLTFDLLRQTDSKTVVDAEENKSRTRSFIKLFASELETKFNRVMQAWSEVGPITASSDAKLNFYKDFERELVDIKIAKDLYIQSKMSRETFYAILRTGELPEDFTADNEAELLEKETGEGMVPKE